MTIQDLTLAWQMAQRFAQAIGHEPAVKQLWALGELSRVEPGKEALDLWVFLDSADEATEKRIVASASSLKEQFPDLYVLVHLTNGAMPEGFDPMDEVYPGAEQIPLPR